MCKNKIVIHLQKEDYIFIPYCTIFGVIDNANSNDFKISYFNDKVIK